MRALSIAAAIIIVIVAGLLIGPSFVNWNKYKGQIVEQIETQTGYQVAINGDLDLHILPVPSFSVKTLQINAPNPGQYDTFLSLESADIHLALMPLFQGNIAVSSVRLVQPEIYLEILQDGSQSWMTATLQEKTQNQTESVGEGAPASSGRLDKVAIDSFQIVGGQIVFANYQTGQTYQVSDADISMKVDNLRGPFSMNGSFTYQDTLYEIDVRTGKLPEQDEGMPLNLTARVPDIEAEVQFDGIAAIIQPYEIQGQTKIRMDNLANVSRLSGKSAPLPEKRFVMEGMLTARESDIAYKDLTVQLGEMSGTGSFDVSNLKSGNPIQVKSRMDLSGTLDLSSLQQNLKAGNQTAQSDQSSQDTKNAPAPGFFPETVTLPANVNGDVAVNIEAVKLNGRLLKGVLAEVNKAGSTIKASTKILEAPGQAKIEGQGTLRFASSSVSEKTGAVTLADPSASFSANGDVDDFPAFLEFAAPEGTDVSVLKSWPIADFILKGNVQPSAISFEDSVLQLGSDRFALSGSYAPARGTGKPSVSVNVVTDTLDIQGLQARLNPKAQKKAETVTQDGSAKKMDLAQTLKPVQSFSLPVNLNFDVSAQKVILPDMDLANVRAAGRYAGQSLTLETLNADNVGGADVSVTGKIENLEALSGLDIQASARSQNVRQTAAFFKMPTEGLPENLKAAEGSAELKGSAETLNFSVNANALNGQLSAAGLMVNALNTPEIRNLSLSIKHPDFAEAMKIVNPGFQVSPGLSQPLDLYAKIASEGKVYNLSGIQGNFGPTSVTGRMRVDMGGAKPSVSGDLQSGTIPLDSFLGAKKAVSQRRSGASSSAANTGGGSRWSRNAIDTSWMHQATLDLKLTANAIQYGGWNFTGPSTSVKLQNGKLNIADLQAGLFGGQATMNATVNSFEKAQEPLNFDLKSSLSNVALEPLVSAFSGSRLLQAKGTGSMDIKINSTGVSPSALVNNLKGDADLDAENVIFEGFDLARLASGLSAEEKIAESVDNVISGALRGGQTQFDTVTGSYAIQEGIVRTNDTIMDGPAARITTTGNANLPQWTIDLKSQIELKNVDDLKPFTVSISGPLDNPANTFGKGVLQDYLQRKVQRKIGKELPGIIGEDATNTLEKLGIIKSQKPAQTPEQEQPAAGEEDNVTPSGTQPQPVQKQQKPKSTEEEAEEAIRGVLEGLIR